MKNVTYSYYKKLEEAIRIEYNIDASRHMCSQLQLLCRQLLMSLVVQKVNDHLLSIDTAELF
jgi:hypothetical protein